MAANIDTIYESSIIIPTSSGKQRKTKQELAIILDACKNVIEEEGQLTLRHLFYRVSSLKLIPKTEQAYHNLARYVTKWRRSGDLPYDAFADGTRWYYGNPGYVDAASALDNLARGYKKNYWQYSDDFIEVWTEKDAMTNILLDVAFPYGIRVFPARGYASLTSLYNASQAFQEAQDDGKTVYVYYFGDHDPSGKDIDRKIIKSLEEDFNVRINFERVAVTSDQIIEYDLPTRPTKKSDTRSRNFEGLSVEIDAMPIAVVKALVRDRIERHIDPDLWEAVKSAEERDKHLLHMISAKMRDMTPRELGSSEEDDGSEAV